MDVKSRVIIKIILFGAVDVFTSVSFNSRVVIN